MLRKIRTILAILFLGLITFYFLDFAGLLPDGFNALERVQFVESIAPSSVRWAYSKMS